MYYVFFEQELIDLRMELDNHPDLSSTIRLQPNEDIYIHLCEIAAHLGIILDGRYTKEDVLELCTIFTKKLREKRIIYVDSGSTPV
jgi:hypothetical protein